MFIAFDWYHVPNEAQHPYSNNVLLKPSNFSHQSQSSSESSGMIWKKEPDRKNDEAEWHRRSISGPGNVFCMVQFFLFFFLFRSYRSWAFDVKLWLGSTHWNNTVNFGPVNNLKFCSLYNCVVLSYYYCDRSILYRNIWRTFNCKFPLPSQLSRGFRITPAIIRQAMQNDKTSQATS